MSIEEDGWERWAVTWGLEKKYFSYGGASSSAPWNLQDSGKTPAMKRHGISKANRLFCRKTLYLCDHRYSCKNVTNVIKMQLLEIFFGSKIRIKILRRLCQQKEWSFSVVELSEDLGLNKGVVSRVLNQLQEDGIVKIITKGKVKLCRVNKENRIVSELIVPIFEKEQSVIDSILKEFLKKLNPKRFKSVLSVIAYGSVVKGVFKLTSDLDFMLILSNKSEIGSIKKTLDKIVDEFSEEDIILFHDLITRGEFKKLYEQNEPAIRDMVRFNKLLYGMDVLELV